ncbi:Imm26 family immunity protein [Priestia taiwanensis]
MTRKKYKLGDVFAIPLQNNIFGFGRVYEDG